MSTIPLPRLADALRALAGQLSGTGRHHVYTYPLPLDSFAVDDDAIPAAATTLLDRIIADYQSGRTGIVSPTDAHPIRSRIAKVEGHCSLTGPEAHNYDLGMRRATRVRDYLVNGGIPAGLVGPAVSAGSTSPRPGHDQPNLENAANRRVELLQEVTAWVPAPPAPPPPPPPPPADASKVWEITTVLEAGASLAIVGGAVILGTLTNVRTQERKGFTITFGGADFGFPITVAVTAYPTPERFEVADWVTFGDFEGQVGIIDAGAPVGPGYTYLHFIGLPGAPTVHIAGINLGIELGVSTGIGYMTVVGL